MKNFKRFISAVTALSMAFMSASFVNAAEKIIPGDIDGNGIADLSDLTLLSMYFLKDIKLDERQLLSADFDGDGKVVIADLAGLKQKISKVSETKEPISNDDAAKTNSAADITKDCLITCRKVIPNGEYSVSDCTEIIRNGEELIAFSEKNECLFSYLTHGSSNQTYGIYAGTPKINMVASVINTDDSNSEYRVSSVKADENGKITVNIDVIPNFDDSSEEPVPAVWTLSVMSNEYDTEQKGIEFSSAEIVINRSSDYKNITDKCLTLCKNERYFKYENPSSIRIIRSKDEFMNMSNGLCGDSDFIREKVTSDLNEMSESLGISDGFFDKYTIVFIHRIEGSGSIVNEISDVLLDKDGNIKINTNTFEPQMQTCDIAGWYIITAIPNEFINENTVFTTEETPVLCVSSHKARKPMKDKIIDMTADSIITCKKESEYINCDNNGINIMNSLDELKEFSSKNGDAFSYLTQDYKDGAKFSLKYKYYFENYKVLTAIINTSDPNETYTVSSVETDKDGNIKVTAERYYDPDSNTNKPTSWSISVIPGSSEQEYVLPEKISSAELIIKDSDRKNITKDCKTASYKQAVKYYSNEEFDDEELLIHSMAEFEELSKKEDVVNDENKTTPEIIAEEFNISEEFFKDNTLALVKRTKYTSDTPNEISDILLGKDGSISINISEFKGLSSRLETWYIIAAIPNNILENSENTDLSVNFVNTVPHN